MNQDSGQARQDGPCRSVLHEGRGVSQQEKKKPPKTDTIGWKLGNYRSASKNNARKPAEQMF